MTCKGFSSRFHVPLKVTFMELGKFFNFSCCWLCDRISEKIGKLIRCFLLKVFQDPSCVFSMGLFLRLLEYRWPETASLFYFSACKFFKSFFSYFLRTLRSILWKCAAIWWKVHEVGKNEIRDSGSETRIWQTFDDWVTVLRNWVVLRSSLHLSHILLFTFYLRLEAFPCSHSLVAYSRCVVSSLCTFSPIATQIIKFLIEKINFSEVTTVFQIQDGERSIFKRFMSLI
jgi:hypothetical protein